MCVGIGQCRWLGLLEAIRYWFSWRQIRLECARQTNKISNWFERISSNFASIVPICRPLFRAVPEQRTNMVRLRSIYPRGTVNNRFLLSNLMPITQCLASPRQLAPFHLKLSETRFPTRSGLVHFATALPFSSLFFLTESKSEAQLESINRVVGLLKSLARKYPISIGGY